MKEIHYFFYIMVLQDGGQIPWIKIHNDDEYRLLEKIGTLELRKPSHVADFIRKIRKASSNSTKKYMNHDNLELQIENGTINVVEDTTLLRRCKLSTWKLLEILLGWHDFLLSYENGEIPGLTHPDERVVD